MPNPSFATLIFKGGRFQGAAMPLEALPELAAYRELVLAVAKGLWQREHTDRHRLPRGFERSFRLTMTGVEAGSTVPVIERTADAQSVMGVTGLDYFEGARDLVTSAIARVGAGLDLPADFPADAVARFNAFGQTLADSDEHILVGPPGARTGERYDRSVRKRILLSRNYTYEDRIELVGEVRAADKDSDGFWLRTQTGERIAVHATSALLPVALHSMGSSVQLRVRGTALFDRGGAVLKVLSTTDVSWAEEGEEGTVSAASCPAGIGAQVEALRGLGSGWFEPGSAPLSAEGLSWLEEVLGETVPAFELATPYLYPTPEGRVRAEWSAPRWETYAEFDVEKHSVELLASRNDAEDVHESELSFARPGSETKLGRFLAEHTK